MENTYLLWTETFPLCFDEGEGKHKDFCLFLLPPSHLHSLPASLPASTRSGSLASEKKKKSSDLNSALVQYEQTQSVNQSYRVRQVEQCTTLNKSRQLVRIELVWLQNLHFYGGQSLTAEASSNEMTHFLSSAQHDGMCSLSRHNGKPLSLFCLIVFLIFTKKYGLLQGSFQSIYLVI